MSDINYFMIGLFLLIGSLIIIIVLLKWLVEKGKSLLIVIIKIIDQNKS